MVDERIENAHVAAAADTFRLALDENDFDTALALLHPACVYSIRGEEIRVAEAIVASYREADEGARRRFDGVSYDSSVVEVSGEAATIEFVDHLVIGESRHTHRCRQIIQVDENAKVTEILHVDLPGQREAVEAFLAQKS